MVANPVTYTGGSKYLK